MKARIVNPVEHTDFRDLTAGETFMIDINGAALIKMYQTGGYNAVWLDTGAPAQFSPTERVVKVETTLMIEV